MAISQSDIVFAFSMEEIYSVGATRFLRDRGPNQFDFQFPGGAADPTPQLDGSLSFDATPKYLSLPAARLTEFYQKLPTSEWAVLASTTTAAPIGGSPRIFSCWNSTGGGVNKGFTVQPNIPNAITMRGMSIVGHGAAGLDYIIGSLVAPTSFPSGRSVMCWTNEAVPRGLHEQARNSYSWGAGVYAATVYDPAIVPRIGCDPAGTNPFTVGRIAYLCAVRGAISSPDLALYSRLIAEGQRPFCVRQ